MNTITEMANAMTEEQFCRLVQFIDPLTEEQEAEFDAMTDDELLEALFA